MNSQLHCSILSILLTRANRAQQHALHALVALTEALAIPNSVSNTLNKAKNELKEAKDILEELKEAKKAVEGPAKARGTLGDEDDKNLQENAKKVEDVAEELEKEKKWAKQWQRWLQAGHGLVMGLVALCGIVLSFDAVRAGLGVAKDSQLLLTLGGVAVSCQVAAQALGTSQRHLGDIANKNRAMAQNLRNRARQVNIAKKYAKATANTREQITNAQAPLELVTGDLETLVMAVDKDMAGGVPQERQKFRKAERFLEDILVTPPEEYRNVTQRLQNAQMALRRQR